MRPRIILVVLLYALAVVFTAASLWELSQQQVMFLQMEGDLFFAVADELQDHFIAIAGSHVRVAIIRLKRTHMIDSTILGVFEQFAQQMKSKDKSVILCGLRPALFERMKAFGLLRTLGENNVFLTDEGVFTSAKRAIARARELVGEPLDLESAAALNRPVPWTYDI